MGPDNLRPPAHPGIILMTGTTSSGKRGERRGAAMMVITSIGKSSFIEIMQPGNL